MEHYAAKRNIGLPGALYNIFAASMILVVTTGHLFAFLVAWEIMSLVSYFLVVYESEKQEVQKAGIIYLVMTHIGTAFITAGFALIYKYTGQAQIDLIAYGSIPDAARNAIFILLLLGFGTKAGIIPLHIWLPYAHPAAPSNISALMSGVMIKTAIYGIIRFIISSGAPVEQWWGTCVLIVGAVSTVLGVAYALMEHNIKRLLAYSSIENIGIILMCLGISMLSASYGNGTLAAVAMTAGLLHTFNHSVFKGLLFMGAGAVYNATGTKNMEKLGGLIKRMPYTAVFFLAGALSISAIPPFNGFTSEWLAYQSMFFSIGSSNGILKLVIIISAALLALAGALAAFCFVKTYGIAFLAIPRSENAKIAKEVDKPMLAGMGILSAACVVLGIMPRLFINLIDRVNNELYKETISGDLTGFSSFITIPETIHPIRVSPLGLLSIIIILGFITYGIIAFVSRGTKKRRYGTWDCGYIKLDSRMQYSATGFSKPLRIVFRGIFRPQRELQIEEGHTPYFFKKARYIASTESIFEKYIYDPAVKEIFSFARKARFVIQTGSIHTYLLYIFIAIILMFVYFVLNKGM
jgi:hydrogenase-4 component B